MNLVDDYSLLENQRKVRLCHEKWRLVFELFLVLARKTSSPLIVVRHFSHHCSTHERRRRVNLSTFLDAFKQRDYDISASLLSRLFYTFDAFEQGDIEWRELAFIFTSIGQRNLTPQEDFCNAFWLHLSGSE